MNLHGVSLKSRVFDPTNLFEAKVKPSLSEELAKFALKKL